MRQNQINIEKLSVLIGEQQTHRLSNGRFGTVAFDLRCDTLLCIMQVAIGYKG